MVPRLLKETLQKSPKSILLLGPRQTGKSTLIESLKPDLSINLNHEKTYLDFRTNPNELNELIAGTKYKTVLIDEIQRLPSLLNTIQTIVDSKEYKHLKFYLTGSSARKLRRGEANLLPGRLLSYEIGGLCCAELGSLFKVQRALKYGCLPEPYLSKESIWTEKLLMSYAGTYLKEEIQAEALTRNLDGFSRFLQFAAQTSGQVLDFSKLAKQAKIERKACTRFYEILEDTLLAKRLEVYEKTSADIQKRPKFYFFDTGVLNGLLNDFSISHGRKGLLFEHLVINQILNSAKARDIQIKLSYFRTRAGYEVDLILEIKNKSYAIEIKSGQVDSTDVKKLKHISQYSGAIDAFYIVHMEERDRVIDGVHIYTLPALLEKVGL